MNIVCTQCGIERTYFGVEVDNHLCIYCDGDAPEIAFCFLCGEIEKLEYETFYNERHICQKCFLEIETCNNCGPQLYTNNKECIQCASKEN